MLSTRRGAFAGIYVQSTRESDSDGETVYVRVGSANFMSNDEDRVFDGAQWERGADCCCCLKWCGT
jgi:hypothetical protein